MLRAGSPAHGSPIRFEANRGAADTGHALNGLGDVPGALRLAAENYRSQREPRDARILLEAALAAKQYAAAQPALDWLRTCTNCSGETP